MADETVIQRQDGATIKIQIKRGTSTNDRDKVKGTVHATDVSEARRKAEDMRSNMESLMESLRAFQPDDDE